jgi:hypothetical protein
MGSPSVPEALVMGGASISRGRARAAAIWGRPASGPVPASSTAPEAVARQLPATERELRLAAAVQDPAVGVLEMRDVGAAQPPGDGEGAP